MGFLRNSDNPEDQQWEKEIFKGLLSATSQEERELVLEILRDKTS